MPAHSGLVPPLCPHPPLAHRASMLALPWAGVAVGLAPSGNLCALEWEAQGAGGCLPALGHSACLTVAGMVASDCSVISLSPTATPMVLPVLFAGPGCPSQPGIIAASTLPSGSCCFLRGRQPDQSLRVLGDAGFGLSPCRKWWHCPDVTMYFPNGWHSEQ